MPLDPTSSTQPGPVSAAVQSASPSSAPASPGTGGPISAAAARGATGSWKAPAPPSDVYDPDAGGMVPDTTGVVSDWLQGVVRAGGEQVAADVDPSYQPPDLYVDDSATLPRSFAPLTPGKSNPVAKLTSATLETLPGVITRAGNAFSGTGFASRLSPDGMTDAERNNAPFHQAYLNMQAQDKVDQATKRQNMTDDAQRAEANYQREQILNSGEYKHALYTGNVKQQNALMARVGDLDKRIAGLQPNYLGQVKEGQGIISSAAQSNLGQAQGEQNLQKGQFEVQHAKMVSNLASQLGTEKDPTRLGQLQNSLLTLLGKDPTDYTVAHAAGETYFDPNNPTVPLKRPDTIVIVNKRSGARQIVPIGGTGTQAAAPRPANLADFLAKAKAANPNASEADLTSYYNKKYGAQ